MIEIYFHSLFTFQTLQLIRHTSALIKSAPSTNDKSSQEPETGVVGAGGLEKALLKVVKQVADGFLGVPPKGRTLSTLGRRTGELGSNMRMFQTCQEGSASDIMYVKKTSIRELK